MATIEIRIRSLGLIESFLYGVYAGLVFVPIYNFLTRRWDAPTKQ